MIERATAADLDAIAALEASGFEHASWSPDAWAGELDAPGRLVLAEREGGVPGGRVRGVASFATLLDTAELLRVVVAPEHRGHGIGRRLVEEGFGWAATHGAQRMLLEVETGNAPARALYDRLGFVTIATRRDYYGPGLDALVMERPLASTTTGATNAPTTPARQRPSERITA